MGFEFGTAAAKRVDVDQLGLEHLFGIAVSNPPRLGTADGNHRAHCREGVDRAGRRQAHGAGDQQDEWIP